MGEGGMLGGGGMSPADVAAVMGNENGWGGNGVWIIALIILCFFGGNWGFGNRGGYQPQYATQDFVQNGFNFNDLQDQNRDLMQAITGGTAQSVAAANQVFHDLFTVVSDKYNELQRDVAGLAVGQANQMANQNDCCCGIKMLIQEVASQQRYESAMQSNAEIQAIHQEGEATRGMIMQNKVEALQEKLTSLEGRFNTQSIRNEIQEATAGVVRYPNAFSYNAGMNPFCGGMGPAPCNI